MVDELLILALPDNAEGCWCDFGDDRIGRRPISFQHLQMPVAQQGLLELNATVEHPCLGTKGRNEKNGCHSNQKRLSCIYLLNIQKTSYSEPLNQCERCSAESILASPDIERMLKSYKPNYKQSGWVG